MKLTILVLFALTTVGFQIRSSRTDVLYDQKILRMLSSNMPYSERTGPGEQTGNRIPIIYTCYDANTELPTGHGAMCIGGTHPSCVANACTNIVK